MLKKITLLFIGLMLLQPVMNTAQTHQKKSAKTHAKSKTPFVWEGANLYFLMTDRFCNGNPKKEIYFNRTKPTAKLRGFEGGNLRGIIQKIDEGYFDQLGVNVIWFTPIVEQIHDGVDEGTGLTYGFHGYWTRDWTALDPNFGSKKDLAELVSKAHAKGIRIMLDGVINHTGPVTEVDTVWPSDWVRTGPQCAYNNYENTTACTLVKNLPDVLTESEKEVELPGFLIQKWRAEGRYQKEMASLDAFFKRTGYPRTPRNYIIKWLTDYIAEFGIDGYRADTVKHVGENVWSDFKTQCDYAFATWKKNNPTKVLDNLPFYTIAEVYNYGISGGQDFDFGDKKVNYFQHGFNSLINFEFKWNAAQLSYEAMFDKYNRQLQGPLKGFSVLNYLSSHDDGKPFDPDRKKPYESANRLLLSQGIAQIYYGDETARSLVVPGTEGDATLRSFMNWEDVASNSETKKILNHWQKLGQFRKKHIAVGAGVHQKISEKPFVFSRTYQQGKMHDRVVIGLELSTGEKEISVGEIFKNGSLVKDAYSGQTAMVKNGKVKFNTEFDLLLIEAQK
ncbi:MAG: alpha-amylase [Bacteroidetes bacterium]|nr:alpha-amylase [Bacteroidota bacterium]